MTTLRNLERRGFLKIAKERPEGVEFRRIKENLRAGRRLTVRQSMLLLKNDEWTGLEKYTVQAMQRLEVLGDVNAEAMPGHLSAFVYGAAKHDLESIKRLRAWLAELIDTSRGFMARNSQSHAYVGVRMLWNHNDKALETDLPLLNRALMHVRASPDFAGYFSKSESGIISYHRRKMLDL